jgi:cell division ATPase FtsA
MNGSVCREHSDSSEVCDCFDLDIENRVITEEQIERAINAVREVSYRDSYEYLDLVVAVFTAAGFEIEE